MEKERARLVKDADYDGAARLSERQAQVQREAQRDAAERTRQQYDVDEPQKQAANKVEKIRKDRAARRGELRTTPPPN